MAAYKTLLQNKIQNINKTLQVTICLPLPFFLIALTLSVYNLHTRHWTHSKHTIPMICVIWTKHGTLPPLPWWCSLLASSHSWPCYIPQQHLRLWIFPQSCYCLVWVLFVLGFVIAILMGVKWHSHKWFSSVFNLWLRMLAPLLVFTSHLCISLGELSFRIFNVFSSVVLPWAISAPYGFWL